MVNEFRVIGKSSTVKTYCGFRMFLNYLLIAVRMFPDSCNIFITIDRIFLERRDELGTFVEDCGN